MYMKYILLALFAFVGCGKETVDSGTGCYNATYSSAHGDVVITEACGFSVCGASGSYKMLAGGLDVIITTPGTCINADSNYCTIAGTAITCVWKS